MAVTLNKANLVLKDANGNIGKIEQLSDRDLTKIRTAMSDVALVVNQSNHTPIEATTTNKGVVQLATSADVVAGASNKVVTAEQLHNATIGTTSAIATSTTVGVVKPDNDTITIDSNGVLTAIKASQDKNGAQIDTTYFKSANGTFTGNEYYRDVNNSVLRFNGGNTRDGGASLLLYGKNAEYTPGVFDLVACTEEDASDSKQLIGKPDGKLIWDDKNIVRSVNGVNADDNGNVSITSVNHATNTDHAGIADSATKAIQDKNGAQIDTTYFKSANGTFTGNEYYRDVNNSVLRFNGGNTHDGGAGLLLFGKNAEYVPGVFDLVASTKEDGSDSKQLIGTPDGTLTWGGKTIAPVTGEIKWFAFNYAPDGFPDGYLICNGANVSRTTYADLFAVIGTTFGSGDGSTTFTLPNLIDKFAQGSTTVGTVKSAGLPDIYGHYVSVVRGDNVMLGAFTVSDLGKNKFDSDGYVDSHPTSLDVLYDARVNFGASLSNSIYGSSSTVQPPALTLLPCIKF